MRRHVLLTLIGLLANAGVFIIIGITPLRVPLFFLYCVGITVSTVMLLIVGWIRRFGPWYYLHFWSPLMFWRLYWKIFKSFFWVASLIYWRFNDDEEYEEE